MSKKRSTVFAAFGLSLAVGLTGVGADSLTPDRVKAAVESSSTTKERGTDRLAVQFYMDDQIINDKKVVGVDAFHKLRAVIQGDRLVRVVVEKNTYDAEGTEKKETEEIATYEEGNIPSTLDFSEGVLHEALVESLEAGDERVELIVYLQSEESATRFKVPTIEREEVVAQEEDVTQEKSAPVTLSAVKTYTLKEELERAIERGYIKGYSDGSIRPKEKVSRQQFAAILSRAMDLKPSTTIPFADVSENMKLAKEIGAVYEAKYMQGGANNMFNPHDTLTREQMIITLAKVLRSQPVELPEIEDVDIADRSLFLTPNGARDALLLNKVGVINGTGKTAEGIVFNPTGLTQRDQVAAALNRLVDAIEELPEGDAVLDSGEQVERPEVEEKPEATPTPPRPVTPPSGEIEQPSTPLDTKGSAFLRADIVYVPSTTSATVRIFKEPNLRNQLTYVSSGVGLYVLENGRNYYKVQVADHIGYVAKSSVKKAPVKVQDHVKVVNGKIHHYVYNYQTKKFVSYEGGPAPSFLKPGMKYYTANGIDYYTALGQKVGTHYPYFQFNSIRSKTNYSAQELNNYIVQALKERERLGYAKYKNASKRSKLLGLGTYLKEAEAKHRVNALFILGAAIHESDYGMSWNAQNKNNLFGIRVFDNSPGDGSKYAAPRYSVDAFIHEYMNAKYVVPNGMYSNGGVPGNKSVGVNVMYASDPDWGAKIAAHMYRADQALGGRDYQENTLGVTAHSREINVYTEPSASSKVLYKYKARDRGASGNLGYPVVVTGEQNGWYQIISDKDSGPGRGWVRASDLNILN